MAARGFVICLAVFTATCAARADELPIRKPGLWDMKMSAKPPMPAATIQQCTDETADRAMMAQVSPLAHETCERNTVTRTATGYATESVCKIAGKTTTTRADITGDFNAAYTVKVTPQLQGGARADTMTIEAKWVGACKADQKPGDVVMPGGIKVNVKDLEAARKLLR